MFAKSPAEQSSLLTTLEGLMERLCSPDLTAAEARDLRPRLLVLLEAIEADRPRPPAPAADRTPACCATA